MAKGTPDYHDADLVLRTYEMRREPLTRASRDAVNSKFWPASYDDLKAIITAPGHELNAPLRQVGSYWEMVYGLVRHGVVDAEYFMETSGEGLFLLARVEPYLEQLRKDTSPYQFVNAEWVGKETERGRGLLNIFRGRVKTRLEAAAKK
jgi:hypothetical protein